MNIIHQLFYIDYFSITHLRLDDLHCLIEHDLVDLSTDSLLQVLIQDLNSIYQFLAAILKAGFKPAYSRLVIAHIWR